MCVALVTQNFGNLASRPAEPVYQIYNGNVLARSKSRNGITGNRNLVEMRGRRRRKVVFAAAESPLVKCFIPANLEERHTGRGDG